MSARVVVGALLVALGCAPKRPAEVGTVAISPAAEAPKVEPVPLPGPLAERPFALPARQRATLGNGLAVTVVENHEVPLVYLSLSFRAGGWADPAGKEGLAVAAMDMLNEGAGKRGAEALEGALRSLGATLATGADDDGASVSLSVLKQNLGPALDILADVVLQPTFPATEWELRRKQRLDALEQERSEPNSIATRVANVVLHGPSYRGRLVSAGSLKAIDVASLAAWHRANVKPAGAVALVGGDVTLDEIVPLLEARLAGWKGTPKAAAPSMAPAPAAPAHLHVVDKPGAPQAVIRAVGFVAPPTDAAWFPQVLANQAFGGQFTSRLNLNLREDKGWTYGARSSVGYDLRGGTFTASAGVVSAHAVDSLAELRKELSEMRASRPVAPEEFRRGRDALALGFPLRFENPGYLLSQEENAWRYGLGADWVDTWLPKLGAVTVEQAQAAWVAQVDPGQVQYVMVGDLASMRPGLDALGVPWSVRDVDGNLGSR